MIKLSHRAIKKAPPKARMTCNPVIMKEGI
jgi:hypothetical protein